MCADRVLAAEITGVKSGTGGATVCPAHPDRYHCVNICAEEIGRLSPLPALLSALHQKSSAGAWEHFPSLMIKYPGGGNTAIWETCRERVSCRAASITHMARCNNSENGRRYLSFSTRLTKSALYSPKPELNVKKKKEWCEDVDATASSE